MGSSGIINVTITNSGEVSTVTCAGAETLDDFSVGSLIRIIGSTSNAGTYRIATISKSGSTPSFTTVELLNAEGSASSAIVDYVLYNTDAISDIRQTNAEKTKTFDYDVDDQAEVLEKPPEEDIEAIENES